MPVSNTRLKWIDAFNTIIPLYQEYKSATGSKHVGLQAMDYNNDGGGKATHTRNTAFVRPTFSDFVCDVEIGARRALASRPEALAYFNRQYRDLYMQLDEVHYSHAELDQEVREAVGKMLIARKIMPLNKYIQGRDVRP